MRTRIVAISLIIIGIVWIGQMASDPQEVVQESESLSPQERAPAAVQAPASPSVNIISGQERDLVMKAQNLQQTLVLETQRLESQRQSLEGLRQRRQEVVESVPPMNRTEALGQIADNTDEIQNLMEDLLQTQNAQSEVHRLAEDAIKNQDSEARAMREELQDRIRRQEADIRMAQEEYTYWQLNGGYINERDERLLSLQQSLDAQLLTLEDLRNQLLQVSRAVVGNQKAIQDQKNQSLREIASEQSNMRGQIRQLRSLTQEIQDQIYAGRRTPMSLNSQLSQAEKSYEEQDQKVRSLQESLINTEEQIRFLQR